MTISERGLELIRHFESLRLGAYKDPGSNAKPYTIGWGTTIYPNGKRVQLGDKITIEQAKEYLLNDISQFEKDVTSLVKSQINQNQFDALVSFAYNVGSDIDQDSIPEGLGDSRLLKKINKNPLDPTISFQFKKWNKSGGKALNGLVARRKAESELYFSPT